MRKQIIAVDPGVNGGYAVRFPNGKVFAYRCPSTPKDMLDDIKYLEQEDCVKICYIEKVHSMPKQGVKSVWTFAENYATWKMIFISLEWKINEVPAANWMKMLIGKLPRDKTARKRELRRRAQNLYPGIPVTLYNADALMLLSVGCDLQSV